tara:strand:- start:123 stop:473 length:351 start_codon:yes stop_codon:yes gene_type:complete
MFSAKTIFIIIAVQITSAFIGRSGKIKNLESFFLILELLSTVALLAIGLYLLSGWEDPTGGMSLADNPRPGGKGGFIILIIKYWPHCLIGWCLYSLYYFIKNGFWSFLLKNLKKSI